MDVDDFDTPTDKDVFQAFRPPVFITLGLTSRCFASSFIAFNMFSVRFALVSRFPLAVLLPVAKLKESYRLIAEYKPVPSAPDLSDSLHWLFSSLARGELSKRARIYRFELPLLLLEKGEYISKNSVDYKNLTPKKFVKLLDGVNALSPL